MNANSVFGFLRETREEAAKAGIDPDFGIVRTGLDDYLAVIFPDVHDWVHDKPLGKVNGELIRKRPDYRSEQLKLIVEFDGLPHYTNPKNIRRDAENTALYERLGYKVVRIPYFIQLSNKAVKTLFGVNVPIPLFNESQPSLGPNSGCTPAFLCPAGIKRMAQEYARFPGQYDASVSFLMRQPKEMQDLIGYELLDEEFRKARSQHT